MKTNFHAVEFQRKVRKKLSAEYWGNPQEFRSRLKKLKSVKVSSRVNDKYENR